MEQSHVAEETLRKVARGTAIVFVGTVLGLLLTFVAKIIVVRHLAQSEYGVFSLALIVLNILVLISAFGLRTGSARQIAYYRGQDDIPKVKAVVHSSFRIAAAGSVILAVALFLGSDIISTRIFHTSELTTPLRVLSFAIPFMALTIIFTSIFQGFDRVDVQVYFNELLRNALFPLFLAAAILLGAALLGVVYAFLAAAVVTFIVFALYTVKRVPWPAKVNRSAAVTIRDLLSFCVPILGASMLENVVLWTDTLMLGYFKSSTAVGLYNGATPLVRLIPIALASMAFIYIPIASQLFSRGQTDEIRRAYAVLTKWVFSATLPLFLVMFLFPEAVLNIVFGPEYIDAALALQILALAYFIHTFLGPNSQTLLVLGRTKLMLLNSAICTVMNVVLNLTLIPSMGIKGAAIASAISLVALNILSSTEVYLLVKAHPFSRNYLKPVIASISLVAIIYVIAGNLFDVKSIWVLGMLFILFFLAYGLSILVTRSFDKEDIMMLLAIEERLGINAAPIKAILKRFV